MLSARSSTVATISALRSSADLRTVHQVSYYMLT
jgi:hypothetical protein